MLPKWQEILKMEKGLSWFMPKMKWDTSVYVNPEQEIRNVSVDNIERKLAKDSYYIPPNTTDSISLSKMKRIKEGIDKGVRFPPIVIGHGSEEYGQGDQISFTDGRHRFAVARELGLKKTPS